MFMNIPHELLGMRSGCAGVVGCDSPRHAGRGS